LLVPNLPGDDGQGGSHAGREMAAGGQAGRPEAVRTRQREMDRAHRARMALMEQARHFGLRTSPQSQRGPRDDLAAQVCMKRQ
jgi:hypothetical protein